MRKYPPPNYLTFNQKPIKEVKGIVLVSEYRYIQNGKFKYTDVLIAMEYKSKEERLKVYNKLKRMFPYKIISYLPD